MYKYDLQNGIIVSKESYHHFPNYKPKENELMSSLDLPVPSTPVYEEGKVIGATELPRPVSQPPERTQEQKDLDLIMQVITNILPDSNPKKAELLNRITARLSV